MNSKPLKVALIEPGGWGYQYGRVFSERADVDFCAVVGRTAEKTQARAARSQPGHGLKSRGFRQA